MSLRKAVFGMRCFWKPDALFGSLEGVVRTRVGYAGGSKDNPTYHSLGDHTEVVMVEYDPSEISYDRLLEVFWSSHDHGKKRKSQYASKIFYISEDQEKKAMESKKANSVTGIERLETFTDAEDYHQKYYLRSSDLMEEFEELSPEELKDSELAAKANGFEAGYISRAEFERYKKRLN